MRQYLKTEGGQTQKGQRAFQSPEKVGQAMAPLAGILSQEFSVGSAPLLLGKLTQLHSQEA